MEDFKNREALVWEGITKLASEIAASEPAMMELVNDVVLSRPNLYAAVAARLARRYL